MENVLHVRLDAPLPSELGVGAGTAVFVAGTCFCPRSPIRRLAVVVDGSEQPVLAHSMPRLDYFRELHPGIDPFATRDLERDARSAEDPLLHSYRSGFWGLARVQRPGAEIGLRAELEDGEIVVAPIGRVAEPEPEPKPGPVAEGGPGPLVAICMATYNPPAELLERQIASIRAQTHRNWVCVVSDDGSSSERFTTLQKTIGDDPRFAVSRAPRRLGFYRNFERALALAPAAADLVAMADQDDRWDQDKLATLISSLGDARLVYSDARVVARDGTVVSDTYWPERRNNHSDLLSLLAANAVTGAASLFPRDLLADALPFPPAQFAHFHDHWVALAALATGRIEFVDRPLYDYVQHGEASLGHAVANRMVPLRARLGALRRHPRERARKWRLHYFADGCRLLQVGTVLEMRCAGRMSAGKRRALRRLLAADRSSRSLAILFARGARELLSRRPETLGAEWMLFYAFLWRRLLALTARDRPTPRLRLDAVPPPALAVQPDRRGASMEGAAVRRVAEKVAPLELIGSDDEPERVNVLIPSVDLDHFFGGYIAMFNLARRLAERGARVRIVTVDPQPPLPRDWRRQVEAFSGLAGALDRVELVFGREGAGLEVSRADRFVASTWWTAHIAHEAVTTLGGRCFLYVVQEHESFTFPMGTYAALADASYRLPHVALYSTELLRDYFRARRIGVASDSASFQNAITAIDPPSADELATRRPRRLLFYARPEPHAARNLFELGVLALDRALAEGAFLTGWELHGIGTVGDERRVALGGGATLDLLPRMSQDEYARVLRSHDLGLALMYTPHPSLVPIEMASAGMLTVTNTFESKTADALAAISPNLIAVEPTIEGVAAGLRTAASAIDAVEKRVAGSDVRWSRDWATTFDDATMRRVEELIALC